MQLRYFGSEAHIDSGCICTTVRILWVWVGSLGSVSCWNMSTRNAVMTTGFCGLELLVLLSFSLTMARVGGSAIDDFALFPGIVGW